MKKEGQVDRSILIVDDEKSIINIIELYLTKSGYKVFSALSGEEAVDLVKKQHIDIVVSDIKMSGMTGIELLQWINSYNRLIPVIITTGFPTIDTAVDALKYGAYDYLTKPFHMEEVIEKVQRAIESKDLREENIVFSKLVSLHEVTKDIASINDIDRICSKLLEKAVGISGSSAGAVLIYENERDLSVEAVYGDDKGSMFSDNFYREIAERVSDDGEPMTVDKNGASLPSELPEMPSYIEALITFPLISPKKTIGTLILLKREDGAVYTSIDLEIINVLASQASISIENARLYSNLRDNYLKTISGFANAVETKDKYTHGHSERVMRYTVLLAMKIGVSGEYLEEVKYAGLLHDIGKIGVDDAILNKPGKLTEGEFEQIKNHPELGARIIADIPFLKPMVPMVHHHHEWYSGEGYPDSLKGEEIPVGARILSIADAFEAMTSDRPYRKSLSVDETLRILEKQSGTQFDPKFVRLFIELIRESKV